MSLSKEIGAVEKRSQVYEGKGKILYETDAPDLLIQYFKDDTTAFNARKKGTINEKGIINNKISSCLFQLLSLKGVPNHFVERLSDREMLIKRVAMLPLEVVIRNVTAGSICRILNIEEGKKLLFPVLEFCYKNDALSDPIINEYHIRSLQLAADIEIDLIKKYAFSVNQIMQEYFGSLNIDLIDFKLEFGRCQGEVILADEISPDTCRLWESGTGRRLDKDRFRKDMGHVEEAYQEVLSRVSQAKT